MRYIIVAALLKENLWVFLCAVYHIFFNFQKKTKMDIEFYIRKFTKLKVDKAHGIAPHKPILLLSVIQLIEKKIIIGNEIHITPELVGQFKSYWSKLVTTNHTERFALPFFHLQSDGFWFLCPNQGFEEILRFKNVLRSFNNLTLAVKYAYLEENLFLLLNGQENRDILRQVIIETYFGDASLTLLDLGNHYIQDLSNQILEETPENYVRKIQTLKKELTEDDFQEEKFVRSGIFRREVLKIYDNTCCISELRIDATANVSMVDVCHIDPFYESFNETINNGFTLCPNLHRAFDSGLIAIDDNFQVLISDKFQENSKSSYQIRSFAKKKILLPLNSKFYPSSEAFYKHRKKFGFHS